MDLNLVVLDGSVTAQNASHLAVQIAKLEQQKILGLYVVDQDLVLDIYASYQKELGRDDRPDSRAELTEWFEAVGNNALGQLRRLCDHANVPVETQILFGGVPELILDRATKAQILTLGRRGRRHASNLGYLGKNFRQIAHHSRIPLLVGGDIDRSIQSLFLLYDDGPNFDIALDLTVRLQHKLSKDVYVAVMDQDDSNNISQDVQDKMLQHGLVDYHRVTLKEESELKMMEAITESGADLIVIGGYRHPEILEWLAGGKIDQILRQCQLPVLIA